jgi:hypothetical protein
MARTHGVDFYRGQTIRPKFLILLCPWQASLHFLRPHSDLPVAVFAMMITRVLLSISFILLLLASVSFSQPAAAAAAAITEESMAVGDGSVVRGAIKRERSTKEMATRRLGKQKGPSPSQICTTVRKCSTYVLILLALGWFHLSCDAHICFSVASYCCLTHDLFVSFLSRRKCSMRQSSHLLVLASRPF